VAPSGVSELLGAMALLWRPTRRAAGLFLLTPAAALAHLYRVQRPELLYPSVWALWLQQSIQGALLGFMVCCTAASDQTHPTSLCLLDALG
jgi:uncharacterized membrane protein